MAVPTFALDSHAQFGGAGTGGMRRGRGPEAALGSGTGNQAPVPSSQDQLSGRLYDLRVRLLIDAAQGPAWDAFYTACMAFAATAPRTAPESAGDSALQATRRLAALAQDRSAHAADLDERTRALFAVLNPDQQHIADMQIPDLLRAQAAVERPQRTWTRDGVR